MDSTHILAHTVAEAVDENHLKASFSLPVTFPSEDQTIPLTLIIDNQEDGVFVQPNAVFLTRDTTDTGPSAEAWLQGRISDLHYPEGIKFPYRSILNETIRNTFFHVALWFAMFILLLAGVYHAFCYIRTHDIAHDTRSSAYTRVALLYGILGLVTGSVWARFTWDTFWTQDIKLNMTAIDMLIYLAYLLLRTSTEDVDKRARLSAAYNIFAFVALIPLVFVIPRLTDSLHPGNGGNPALGGGDLDNTPRLFFYPSIIALALLVIISYPFLVRTLELTHIQNTFIVYVIAFFALDFAGYWVHRLQHVTNFFWNGHIIHHSSEEFKLACALRQSISAIVKIFAIFLLPAALLGVPREVIEIVAPLHLFAQFWYHTQHIGRMGFLEKVIVTPSHHRLHHGINPIYMDKNYSQIFIFWDKLFGTFQEELADVPPVYGITRPVRTWNPIKINLQHDM